MLKGKGKVKEAVIIRKTGADRVSLGSTILVDINGAERIFEMVGPKEANPSRGRISHRSPIGMALLGRGAGEDVRVKTPRGEILYHIKSVR